LLSSVHLEIEGLKDNFLQVELLFANVVVPLMVVDLQTMVHSIEKHVDGFLGLRKEDDHVGTYKLSPRIKVVVGTIACHVTNTCGFGPSGGPIRRRDHCVSNFCALG
jgi:hypothetical protein